MISATEALQRLKEGNGRYISEKLRLRELFTGQHRNSSLKEQRPFAVVLACSDSRVPVEVIFDQGLGDLFVIRVAGNIAAPSQVGSIEFAIESWSVPLVVVLGHSMCGAVSAAIESLQKELVPSSSYTHYILNQIKTPIEKLVLNEVSCDHGTLVQKAVQANVQSATEKLERDSEILKQRIDRQSLLVLGAEYSLKTGLVDFYD